MAAGPGRAGRGVVRRRGPGGGQVARSGGTRAHAGCSPAPAAGGAQRRRRQASTPSAAAPTGRAAPAPAPTTRISACLDCRSAASHPETRRQPSGWGHPPPPARATVNAGRRGAGGSLCVPLTLSTDPRDAGPLVVAALRSQAETHPRRGSGWDEDFLLDGRARNGPSSYIAGRCELRGGPWPAPGARQRGGGEPGVYTFKNRTGPLAVQRPGRRRRLTVERSRDTRRRGLGARHLPHGTAAAAGGGRLWRLLGGRVWRLGPAAPPPRSMGLREHRDALTAAAAATDAGPAGARGAAAAARPGGARAPVRRCPAGRQRGVGVHGAQGLSSPLQGRGAGCMKCSVVSIGYT
jgi:hypothetical protein